MNPEAIAGYRVLRRLGVGGMGEVFVARQETAAGLGRAVVIKTLGQRGQGSGTRLLDEARLASRLRHKNICGVTHVGEADGEPYLVMDYVAGRDLQDVLQALSGVGRRVQPSLGLLIVRDVLHALAYAHTLADPQTRVPLGVVHRDVSPANIMIGLDGEVRLIDFGLAVSTLKSEQTAAGTLVGKLRYMSPEQVRGEPVDARADLYSVGIVATELLSGASFYAGMDRDAVLAVAERGYPSPALADVEDDIRAALTRALEPDRARRVGTAAELAAACDALIDARHETVGADDVRALMRSLFPDELRRQRSLLAEALAAESGPATDDVIFFSRLEQGQRELTPPIREPTQIVRTRKVHTEKTHISNPREVTQRDVTQREITHVSTTKKVPLPSGSRAPLIAGIAAGVLVVGALAVALFTAPPGEARDAGVPAVNARDAGARPRDAGERATDVVDAGAPSEAPVEVLDAGEAPARDAGVRAVIPKRPKGPTPTSTPEKLKLLSGCKHKCARPVVDKSRRLLQLSVEEARAWQVELDACVKRCE